MELTEKDRGTLLTAARDSIKAFYENLNPPIIDYLDYPNLKISAGAFVTLKIFGQLRGCIGYIISKTSVFETICNAAVQAAFHDPRFFPVTEDEIKDISIEISILSLPVLIKEFSEIKLGLHGLILEYDRYRSLLLPQVAVEHNFTVEKFVSALFEKAGLMPELWRKGKFNISTFTATVFSDFEKSEKNYEQI